VFSENDNWLEEVRVARRMVGLGQSMVDISILDPTYTVQRGQQHCSGLVVDRPLLGELVERGRAVVLVLEVGALDGTQSEWTDVVGMLGGVDGVVGRPSVCWGHRVGCWERLGFASLASMEFLSDGVVLAFLYEYGPVFAVSRLVDVELD